MASASCVRVSAVRSDGENISTGGRVPGETVALGQTGLVVGFKVAGHGDSLLHHPVDCGPSKRFSRGNTGPAVIEDRDLQALVAIAHRVFDFAIGNRHADSPALADAGDGPARAQSGAPLDRIGHGIGEVGFALQEIAVAAIVRRLRFPPR